MIGITVVAVVIALAVVVGTVLRRRDGRVRTSPVTESTAARTDQLRAAGVSEQSPTILHFSASWCGPCAAVRRVVGSVVADLADSDRPPVEVEVDMDENPTLAREMGVMSLPTTFVLAADLSERSRVSGVPTARDLRDAVAAAS